MADKLVITKDDQAIIKFAKSYNGRFENKDPDKHRWILLVKKLAEIYDL